MSESIADAIDPVHVRVEHVEKSYGAQKVLRDVSFEIRRGTIHFVLGASGSGKTVLLRQMVRLEKPQKGRVLVDGTDIIPLSDVEMIPWRRKFGVVFQMSALFDSMTVFDNVAFLLREHTKMKRKEIEERVMDRLKALGVEHAAHKIPAELSGGMRKRVAVARALVLEPQVLYYDEPVTGLDPVTSRTVDDLVRETQERFNVTSVVISHDMSSVFRIAHHVSMLAEGVVVFSGSPEEFRISDNPKVRNFLDASGFVNP